jgi:glucokinase
MTRNILAADIGGTNSRFAHFSFSAGSQIALEQSTWLRTADVNSFFELIQALRKSDFKLKPETADIVSIAAAGPVQRQVFCAPPLIKWTIDLTNAEADFGISKFVMINDFVAQAYACRSPIGQSAQQILDGEIDTNGTVAVIGAGTGLGKAFLVRDSRGMYIAGPSEGGHVSFAAENEREFEFQRFVVAKRGGRYASTNDIVSGRGLALIHEFLTKNVIEPAEIAKNFDAHPETLEWFARFYGRVGRNFALDTLATGGVYVTGGVAAKNPVIVKHEEFHKVFRDSRAHEALLARIPVFLISNEDSGLWGAGLLGSQLLASLQ